MEAKIPSLRQAQGAYPELVEGIWLTSLCGYCCRSYFLALFTGCHHASKRLPKIAPIINIHRLGAISL